MNATDYDKAKFSSDKYGHLTAKTEPKIQTHNYRGYKIDVGIGNVKVWDTSDNFVNDFPDVKTAKDEIDCILLLTK